MKKRLWLWLALLLPLASWAQTPEQNMMKYWRHRQQLDRFICRDALNLGPAAVSTTRGSFLVAASRENHINCLANPEFGRNGVGDTDDCTTLDGINHTTLGSLSESHHMMSSTGFPLPGIAAFIGNECSGMRYGADQTLELGYYIGVLATEWRLLTNSGQDATATAQELWAALEAYERLDRNAELIYAPYPSVGVFDGYFLRDDLLDPFYPTRDDDLDGNPNFPGVGCATSSYNSQPGKGRAYFPSSQYTAYGECYVNVPSPDQALALLMGMALVAKSVDPGVMVFGEDLRGKAQYTAHLLVKYAREHGNWNYFNPEGHNYENRTGVLMFAFQMAEAANRITGNSQTVDFNGDGIVPDALVEYHNVSSYATQSLWEDAQEEWVEFPNTIPEFFLELIWSPNNDVTLSQTLTACSLADYDHTGDFINTLASHHHLEGFALLRDYLNDKNNTTTAMMDEVERLLNLAPCYKFCNCPDGENVFPADGGCAPTFTQNCNPVPEWQSINRWTHVSSRFGNGYKQDYTGLDFMLMHNLYLLLSPGAVRQYTNTYYGTREIVLDAPISVMGGMLYFDSHIQPGLYVTNEDITSVAKIEAPFSTGDNRNGDVTYRAGQSIRLLPGFLAETGAYFRAYIDDFQCAGGNEFHKTTQGTTTPEGEDFSAPLLSQDATLSVYPNPSLGEFQITGVFPEATSVSWSLYSIMGSRLMGSEGEAAVTEYADEIDLAGYPASTYILVIQAGEQQHRFRLIKQ